MGRNRLLGKVNRNILFFSGLFFIVLIFVGLALFAPYIATHDPAFIDFDSVFFTPHLQSIISARMI